MRDGRAPGAGGLAGDDHAPDVRTGRAVADAAGLARMVPVPPGDVEVRVEAARGSGVPIVLQVGLEPGVTWRKTVEMPAAAAISLTATSVTAGQIDFWLVPGDQAPVGAAAIAALGRSACTFGGASLVDAV